MMLILDDKDIVDLKDGRTKFVERPQSWKKTVLAYISTQAEALKMLGKQIKVEMEPKAGQTKCAGCNGIMEYHLLYEGKCIVCWANHAKRTKRDS